MAKPATVRFYIDADILGLAHVVCGLRPDSTYPGDPGAEIHKQTRPACSILPSTPDELWLPITAANGWLVISRDHNIRENAAERRAVRDHGARMVALSGADASDKWSQLKLLLRWWDRIDEVASEVGPFIYLASKSGFNPLDLDD